MKYIFWMDAIYEVCSQGGSFTLVREPTFHHWCQAMSSHFAEHGWKLES